MNNKLTAKIENNTSIKQILYIQIGNDLSDTEVC